MTDETPTPTPEAPKVPFNAKIYLTSGSVIELTNLTKLDGSREAEKLVRLEWEFTPNTQANLLYIDVTKVEAITLYR